jgi:hypothetical protein
MAKTRGTGLLMVWSDIDAEFEAEFNRWYDEVSNGTQSGPRIGMQKGPPSPASGQACPGSE